MKPQPLASIGIIIAGQNIFEVLPGVDDDSSDVCKRSLPHEWNFLGHGTVTVNGVGGEFPYRDLHQCKTCKTLRWLKGPRGTTL